MCQGQEVESGLVQSEDCTYSTLVWVACKEAWESEVGWCSQAHLEKSLPWGKEDITAGFQGREKPSDLFFLRFSWWVDAMEKRT